LLFFRQEIKMGNLCKVLLFTLLFSLPSLAGCTQHEKINEQALYDKAQAAIDSYPGNQSGLDKAEKLLKKIYKANRQSALAQTALGRLAYKEGYINYKNFSQKSLTEAHSRFAKALSINPHFFDAYYYGTYPYIYENNFVKAKEMASKCQEIDPNSPKVDILFAEIAKSESDSDEVERRAKRVIDSTSDKKLLIDAYSLLAWVYQVRNQNALADDAYQKNIEQDPASPWAKKNYSKFLTSLGRYDDAINYGKQALEIMDFGMGHYVLGQALYRKGVDLYWKDKRPEEAKIYFEDSIRQDPENADAYYGIGMSLYNIGWRNKNVGDVKKAATALNKAIELNPDHQGAKIALERLEMLLRAVDK
jgi:tetratricopeptide (TPR) repeat protein